MVVGATMYEAMAEWKERVDCAACLLARAWARGRERRGGPSRCSLLGLLRSPHKLFEQKLSSCSAFAVKFGIRELVSGLLENVPILLTSPFCRASCCGMGICD